MRLDGVRFQLADIGFEILHRLFGLRAEEAVRGAVQEAEFDQALLEAARGGEEVK